MARVSIIIPIYKGIRYLRQAINSVKSQTFSDWECLCIDDGSRDGSGQLADELAADDSRIRVIHQANGGTSVARNTGMAEARGEFLAFLDEDDILHPNYLEVLVGIAERTHADIIGCEMKKFAHDADPGFVKGELPETSELVYDQNGIKDLVAEMYSGMPYEIWRNIYRREVFKDCPFPVGVRVEQDLAWLYPNLARCRTYAKIDWQGYGWRQNPQGGYLNPDSESILSLLKTYLKILDIFSQRMNLSPNQKLRIAERICCDIDHNIRLPLCRGLKFSHEDHKKFSRLMRELEAYGIIYHRHLHFAKRMRWLLFLRTRWGKII